MNKQYLVVDSQYIHRRYQCIGVYGKGKEFIFDFSSTLNLVRQRKKVLLEDEDNSDDGTGPIYILQVYNALPIDIFRKKVQQLQGAMTEYITNLHTRIVLIGKKKINAGTFDLLVLYDVDQLMEKTLHQEILDRKSAGNLYTEDEAKELLVVLTQNLLLNGRFTYEFLDINPHNILMNPKMHPNHGQYAISNFGIGFIGSKFYRRYTCPSDPFFSEPLNEKSVPQVMFTYAFSAGLVVLQCILGLDVKDMFRENKYNETLMMQLLNFLLVQVGESGEDKYEKKKEEILKRTPSLEHFKEKGVKLPAISPEFTDILKRLLTTDQSKRSIFVQLISPGINMLLRQTLMLDGKHPWIIPGFEAEGTGTYLGIGTADVEETEPLEGEVKVHLSNKPQKALPEGCGRCFLTAEPNRYGTFVAGAPSGLGCLQLKEEGSAATFVVGTWSGVATVEEGLLYRANRWVYQGAITPTTWVEDGEGVAMYVTPFNSEQILNNVPLFAEGSFTNGKLLKGKCWFKNHNVFDGEFDGFHPKQGLMKYKEEGHVFDGSFKDGRRAEGTLTFQNKMSFTGTFDNDQIKLGTLNYPDGAVYMGEFQRVQRHGTGIYIYSNGMVRYQGMFEKNRMHGKGMIVFTKDDQEQKYNVLYVQGVLKTNDLPVEVTLLLQGKQLKIDEIPELIDGEDEQQEGQNNDDVGDDAANEDES